MCDETTHHCFVQVVVVPNVVMSLSDPKDGTGTRKYVCTVSKDLSLNGNALRSAEIGALMLSSALKVIIHDFTDVFFVMFRTLNLG